jgi:protocatechuate 3,4-dioxygenase beta subunit
MKRTAVLGIVVLLAALAGGAIYWKSRGKTDATSAAKRAVEGAGPTAPTSAAKPKPGEAAAPAVDLSLRLDDDPKGPLRLEGQVIDEDEHPVAGAIVAIDANPPREVKTEADGAFVFDALLQRGYRIEAHKDDLHGGPVSVNVVAKTEPVTVRLVAGVSLDVTVQDGDSKKPVGGAHVEVRTIATIEAAAGADGVAHLRGLRGGWVSLKVQASGYAPAFSTLQLPVAPGASDHQTVLLRRGVAVAGRVVDEAGKPVAGARVLPASSASFFGGADERLDAATSDAAGRWKIAAVAPGSWRFEATSPSHAPGQSAPVILSAGGAAPAEIVITLPAAGSLDGEVHSASGQPVPFATVRVSSPTESLGSGGARQASCDDAGRFHMDGLPRRKASVLAAHESGSSDVTTLDLATTPEQKNLVLVLSQDGAIAGTVVTPKGQPVAEARVVALPELGDGIDADSATRWRLLGGISDVADQAGAFRLSGLPKGKYRLRAMRADASMMDPSTMQRRGETAETGATNVKIVLEDDAVLKGKLAFKDGKAPDTFTVSTSAFGASTPFSSKDGSFRLEHVAPGPRLLTVSGPGFTRKTTDPYEAKPGVETDVGTITVERGRTVRGRVLKADGSPSVGATVYAGTRFMGSGDSIKLQGGGGGAATAFGKDTVTDAEGRFELTGVGVRAVLLVADSDDGRSQTQPVPPGEADVNVQLGLVAPGAIEGKVTSGGAPMAGAAVVAQAQSSYRGQFIVKAGDDGNFRFDRLSPDIYLVSAVRPQSIGAFDMQTEVARVESGKVAHVELTMVKTDLALTVTVVTADTKPLKSGIAFLLAGACNATTAIEIEHVLAAKGAGGFQQGFIMGGQPKTFPNLSAGNYTVCVLPVAGDLSDTNDTERAFRDPDALPVTCKALVVAAAPNDQALTVTVPKPAP